MAFHSSSVIINEISNLLLVFLTNDFTKSITTYNSPISLNESSFKGNDFLQNLACIDVLPVSILNLINAEIIALIISLISIHITKERQNGFKTLQFISSTHYGTYWLSNYIFDLAICLFNIITMIVVLKLVDLIKNDPTNEINPIVTNSSILYVLLLLMVSSLAWPPLAYLCSFLFKSDIISFIVLFIVLSVAAFLDMLWSFVQLFMNLETSESNSFAASLLNTFRYSFAFLFPNVTIKRGLYNIKISKNLNCIMSLNGVLKSKI